MSNKWFLVVFAIFTALHYYFDPKPTVEDYMIFAVAMGCILIVGLRLEDEIKGLKEQIATLEDKLDDRIRISEGDIIDLKDEVANLGGRNLYAEHRGE